MKYPSIRLIFDRTKTATKDKPGTVYVEVLHNRVRRYYNTGVRVCTGQWSDSKMVINHPDSFSLNQRINSIRSKVEFYINKCITDDRTFSFDGLEIYLSAKSNTNSFIDFMQSRIEERTDLRPNTIKNHRTSLSILKEFGEIESFDDITPDKIRRYDAWLHKKYNSQTSVHFHHKELKVYINEAIRAGIIKQNPYDLIPVSRGKSSLRRYLEEEEIEMIKHADMPTESLSRVRDLFIFQCYTGLAYADLAKFDFSKAVNRGGKYIVYDARQKSGEDFYLVLLSPAVEILKKYDFKLPQITNQQYNLRLKSVADYAKITKNLTSHMARHSFAVYCVNNGIAIETLARMMGHNDIKTTQI